MKLFKQITYFADGPRARVTALKGDKLRHIRIEKFCNQMQELVVSDFATGTPAELYNRWVAWQNEGYDHANQFGKVHVGTLDG